MGSLTPQVTKSVDDITSETGTTKAESTMRSIRFWQSCQDGKSPNDVLTTAGFEVDFQPVDERYVREVTLRLDPSWMSILQRKLDRNKA